MAIAKKHWNLVKPMIFRNCWFQIRNVVCNYTLPLHIDLRRFALNSANVTYDRGRGVSSIYDYFYIHYCSGFVEAKT